MHALINELAIRRVEHRSEIHFNESQHLAEGTKVARLWRRFSFALEQALSFHTRHPLSRQRMALAGTRQLRSQGPVSVDVHCTEEVTGFEGREGVNGAGGETGVAGGNGDWNGVGGMIGDINVDGYGDGSGTRTGVEANERTHDGNGDGSGDGAEAGTGLETRGRINIVTGTEEGTEPRAVAEVGTGTGTRTRSSKAEEWRRSARSSTHPVDMMWQTGETWAERGKNVEKKGFVQ